MTIDARGERFAAGPPPAAVPFRRLAYHFLAAVDIEGFSRLDVLEQVIQQSRLGGVLERAAERARLDRASWEVQPAGDGELAVLPGDIDASRLVADYPRELARALAETNGERGELPRLRVRLALHHGIVVPGGLGPVGRAPIEISRLLDSEALRRELRRRLNEDLVLIVSSALYRDVVESRFRGLDPADFFFTSEVVKGQSFPGHIHRGSRPAIRPPGPGRVPPRRRPAPGASLFGRWRSGDHAP